MKKIIAGALLVVALAGCVGNPVPDGYTGPVVTITDSIKVYSSTKADFFYVEKIGDTKVDNCLTATRKHNAGRGMSMEAVDFGRSVPAQISTFHIVGRTDYAAPVLALVSTVYEISGDVSFTPQVGKTYLVKGSLAEDASSVWIEDAATHQVMGNKIQVQGSTALPIYKK